MEAERTTKRKAETEEPEDDHTEEAVHQGEKRKEAEAVEDEMADEDADLRRAKRSSIQDGKWLTRKASSVSDMDPRCTPEKGQAVTRKVMNR